MGGLFTLPLGWGLGSCLGNSTILLWSLLDQRLLNGKTPFSRPSPAGFFFLILVPIVFWDESSGRNSSVVDLIISVDSMKRCDEMRTTRKSRSSRQSTSSTSTGS